MTRTTRAQPRSRGAGGHGAREERPIGRSFVEHVGLEVLRPWEEEVDR
jgi:hypothetical protein